MEELHQARVPSGRISHNKQRSDAISGRTWGTLFRQKNWSSKNLVQAQEVVGEVVAAAVQGEVVEKVAPILSLASRWASEFVAGLSQEALGFWMPSALERGFWLYGPGYQKPRIGHADPSRVQKLGRTRNQTTQVPSNRRSGWSTLGNLRLLPELEKGRERLSKKT